MNTKMIRGDCVLKFGFEGFVTDCGNWARDIKTIGYLVKTVYEDGTEILPQNEELQRIVKEHEDLLVVIKEKVVNGLTGERQEALLYYLPLKNLGEFSEGEVDLTTYRDLWSEQTEDEIKEHVTEYATLIENIKKSIEDIRYDLRICRTDTCRFVLTMTLREKEYDLCKAKERLSDLKSLLKIKQEGHKITLEMVLEARSD